MTNLEILNLSEIITAYSTQIKMLKGAKFAYAVVKNTDRLTSETKIILNSRSIDERFKEYDEKRVALCERLAEKDETGASKRKMNSAGQLEFVLNAESTEFKDAINELKDEFAEAIQTQEKNDADFNAFLSAENTSFELHRIPLEDFPQEISVEVLSALKHMIRE